MPIVQIIASEPVRYSLDNGVTLSEFEPNEYYNVPDYVAAGMQRRNWAKLAGGEQQLPDPHVQYPPKQPEQPQPEPPKPDVKEKPEDEEHDHHEDDRTHEKSALRAKRRN